MKHRRIKYLYLHILGAQPKYLGLKSINPGLGEVEREIYVLFRCQSPTVERPYDNRNGSLKAKISGLKGIFCLG